METQYKVEITINGFTEVGLIRFDKRSIILELNGNYKNIPYKTITKILRTDDGKILLNLSNGSELTLNMFDNEVLVSTIKNRETDSDRSMKRWRIILGIILIAIGLSINTSSNKSIARKEMKYCYKEKLKSNSGLLLVRCNGNNNEHFSCSGYDIKNRLHFSGQVYFKNGQWIGYCQVD